MRIVGEFGCSNVFPSRISLGWSRGGSRGRERMIVFTVSDGLVEGWPVSKRRVWTAGGGCS